MVSIKHYPVFLASLALLSAPALASDAASQKQSMTYDVYAGGIHAVEATLDLDQSKKGRYSAVVNAKTRGFLAKLAPWKGSFETYGWRKNGADLRPELHKSTGDWKGEVETKEYNYSKDGGFQSLHIKDHDKPRRTEVVDSALTKDTIDVLTATMLEFDGVAKTGNCNGSSTVFDGKRRFKMKFQHKAVEQLAASKYNIFEGQAVRCTIEVVPDGGGWHDKPRGWLSIQEQGRDKGTMPTIWLGQVEEGGAYVPIKILVKTDYGSLFMHLAQYKGASTELVANKKAE